MIKNLYKKIIKELTHELRGQNRNIIYIYTLII